MSWKQAKGIRSRKREQFKLWQIYSDWLLTGLLAMNGWIMNRREFLTCCVAAGASVAFGGCVESGINLSQADRDDLRGLTIIDAHAHPYQLAGMQYDASMPTCELINSVGMVACSFSAVGDLVKYGGRSGSSYSL